MEGKKRRYLSGMHLDKFILCLLPFSDFLSFFDKLSDNSLDLCNYTHNEGLFVIPKNKHCQ